jgi:hypothetical protein
MATNTPVNFYRGNPQYGTGTGQITQTNVQRNVTNAALTSNLVTLTFGSNHGLTQVGTLISVQGVSSVYDGLYPINSFPANNTATYVVTNANIGSAAVTPNGAAIMNSSIVTGGTISNVAIVNYTGIVTTGSAHGLAIGDIVRLNVGQTGIDGTWVVSGVQSTTLFTFSSTTQTLASTAITQGAFGRFPANYTLAASTNGIVTNAVFSNPTASSATVDLTINGIAVAKQLAITSNGSTFLDIKQYFTTTQSIVIGASIAQIDAQVSGITIQ